MPIVDGVYKSPNWNNGGPPAINAEELNAMSESITTGIPADYQDIQAGESISFLDPVDIVGGKAVKTKRQAFDYNGATTALTNNDFIVYSYIIDNSTIIVCSLNSIKSIATLTLNKLVGSNWNSVSSIKYNMISDTTYGWAYNSPIGRISQLSSTIFAVPYINHNQSSNANNVVMATFSVSGNTISTITSSVLGTMNYTSQSQQISISSVSTGSGVFVMCTVQTQSSSFYNGVTPYMAFINYSTGAITSSVAGTAITDAIDSGGTPGIISMTATTVMFMYTVFRSGNIDYPATIVFTISSSTITSGSQQGLSTEFGYRVSTRFNLTKNSSGQVCGVFAYNSSGSSSSVIKSGVVCRFNTNGTLATRTNYIGEDIEFFSIPDRYNYSYQNTQNIMASNFYMYSLNLPVNGTPTKTQAVRTIDVPSMKNITLDAISGCLAIINNASALVFNLVNRNMSTQAIALKAANSGAQTRVIYDGIWYDTSIPVNTSIYTDGVSAYSPIAGKLCITGKPSSQISVGTYAGNGGVAKISTGFMPDMIKIWIMNTPNNYTYVATIHRGNFSDFISSAPTGSSTSYRFVVNSEINKDGFITSGDTNNSGEVYQYWAYKY